MTIHGLNKLTMLDFPGRLACTVFTGGCNFRCPFCQNASLVLAPETQPVISEEEILSFLKSRKGRLEGICITGGEPTLFPGLFDFVKKVKEMDYLVKIDTNGTNPELLGTMMDEGMIDYIAMDIKSSKEHYLKSAGIKEGTEEVEKVMENVEKSVRLIMERMKEYEFRTTVVKGLHERGDFEAIARWLSGCRAYYLQQYRDGEDIIGKLYGNSHIVYGSFEKSELEEFVKILGQKIEHVEIRGI